MAKFAVEVDVDAVVAELDRDQRGAVPDLFCQHWPKARTILKYFGTSGNCIVKLACSILLNVGNALAKQCPT